MFTTLFLILLAAPHGAAGVKQSLAVLQAAGPNGANSKEAARAWQDLAGADVQLLPEILAGLDGANPVARNWIRSALDAVLDRARGAKKAAAAAELETFLRDRRHDPSGRRLAYELILEQDPKAADRFLPDMLDDPSPELRRDAVARVLDEAEKQFTAGKKADALPLFRKALASARDKDQLDKAARRLKDLGQPVDLVRHLGLIQDWKLIGPFPYDPQKAADTVYPPEKSLEADAAYDGTAGKVRWKPFASKDEQGLVDLNAGIGPEKQATGYAWTEFDSPETREAEIRLGCYNKFTLWVNGQPVLARSDAYTGMRLDHYVAKVRLRKGKNTILLKVSKEEPPGPVPPHWRFLLRVCDAGGAAILAVNRPSGN